MIWQYFEIVYENILYYYNNFFGIRNNNDFDQVMYKYLLTDSVNYNTSEVDKLIDDTMKEIKVDSLRAGTIIEAFKLLILRNLFSINSKHLLSALTSKQFCKYYEVHLLQGYQRSLK